jgi:mRNA interferase MazF
MMRYGMMYKQGDILLIPIPFSDLTTHKQRPVLVLSNTQYNEKTEDIVVAAVTSNLSNKDYGVVLTNEVLESGNLKGQSLIRVDKIYTLSQKIVIKRFGSTKSEILDQVRQSLNKLI